MAIQQPSDSVAVRNGILTPDEFAALDPRMAAEVEEVIASMAQKPNHNAAWFAKHRDEIRENMTFFIGVLRSDTPQD